jgi:hypothetical protein
MSYMITIFNTQTWELTCGLAARAEEEKEKGKLSIIDIIDAATTGFFIQYHLIIA